MIAFLLTSVLADTLKCKFWVDDARYYDLTRLKRVPPAQSFYSVQSFQQESIYFEFCSQLLPNDLPPVA